jgi:GntR family transcriptional regulator
MQETIKKIEKPLYLQVADDIRNRIQNGEFKAKEKLDTEFELEKQYSVSRITIRKALELLVDEGILMRKRRVGTYVMEKKIARNLNWSGSFSKSCKMEGNQVRTKLLSAELIPARPNDIERLQIPKDDYIIRIRRLRFCNGEPVIIEDNHYPRTFSYLLAEDLENRSLYEILAEHNIKIVYSMKTIGVCYATREEAQYMNIRENDALLLSRDVTYDENNKPVFRGKEIINADKFEYKILQRNSEQVLIN